jgi:hypothetical protein
MLDAVRGAEGAVVKDTLSADTVTVFETEKGPFF